MYRYHFLPGTNSSLLGRIGGVSDSGLSIGIPRVSLIEWLKCDREGSDSQYHNRFTSKDGSLFIDMNETWLPSIYMKEMTLLSRKTGAFTFFLLSVSYCPHTQIQKNLKLIFKKIRESTLWRTEELQTYSKNRSKCILLLWVWPLTLEYSILFFFSFYLLIPQTVIKMCEPNTDKEMSGYIFYHCISAKTTTRINPRYVPQPVVPLAAGAVNERLSDNNILKL